MEELKIEKYPVLAGSAAGPVGLRMAIQYPERVQALLMLCAATGNY